MAKPYDARLNAVFTLGSDVLHPNCIVMRTAVISSNVGGTYIEVFFTDVLYRVYMFRIGPDKGLIIGRFELRRHKLKAMY